jgi:methyltransferase
VIGWAYWFLGFIALQRCAELAYAHYNTRRLLKRGGREVGAGHYPLFIVLHGSWLLSLASLTASTPPFHWQLLGLFAVLQVLRLWVIASLGPYWTTRIVTLDGAPLCGRGPYRWLRHPNYLIVAAEVPLVPLILDLPVAALAFGLINLILLTYRIHVEDKTLAARQPH